MTALQLKIVDDWKSALKNKSFKKDTLSLIINELKNRAIKEGAATSESRVVSDEIAIEVLLKMAKQRKEAIESFQAANRKDLAEKEAIELSIIEEYLPKKLTDNELKALVLDAIKELSATGTKDIGRVMGLAIKKAAGRADGRIIQQIVQEELAKFNI